MADLTIQTPNEAGIAGTLASADVAGDAFIPSGRNWIEFDNASGGAITVTFSVFVDGLEIADGRTVTVPAGARRLVRLQNITPYIDPDDGKVKMAYSGVTSLTVGVFGV